MVISKDELLCYAPTHTDVHLSQQLSSCLTPAVVLWKQRHLQNKEQDDRYELRWVNKRSIERWKAHMSESWTTRHDGGLVDRHCIFGEIGNNGMARLMVGSDGLVLLVNLNTPPLGTLRDEKKSSTSDFNENLGGGNISRKAWN